MKGVVCYYSGSGNTKLACRYIARHTKNVQFDLFNMVKDGVPALDKYDIVGFAAFTDFGAPSQTVRAFIDGLPRRSAKPAFVFNTFGFLSGKTLAVLDEWVTARGFNVIAAHSLHTPESYPPMIARRMANEQAPNKREMARFDTFVSELDQLGTALESGQPAASTTVKVGLLGRFMPVPARTQARDDMGERYVDESLCKQCGVCEKGCPYQAIELDPFPVFDMGECYGCWYCYNHCSKKAIYTDKYRSGPHYPKPIERLREKLQA